MLIYFKFHPITLHARAILSHIKNSIGITSFYLRHSNPETKCRLQNFSNTYNMSPDTLFQPFKPHSYINPWPRAIPSTANTFTINLKPSHLKRQFKSRSRATFPLHAAAYLHGFLIPLLLLLLILAFRGRHYTLALRPENSVTMIASNLATSQAGWKCYVFFT